MFHHPTHNVHVVVGTDVTREIERSTQSAALGIPGAENHRSHACLHQGASTHGTGFKRHNQRAVVEAPISADPCCLPQRDELRMTKGVLMVMPAISTVADCPSNTV